MTDKNDMTPQQRYERLRNTAISLVQHAQAVGCTYQEICDALMGCLITVAFEALGTPTAVADWFHETGNVCEREDVAEALKSGSLPPVERH